MRGRRREEKRKVGKPLGSLQINLHDADLSLLRNALHGGDGGSVQITRKFSRFNEEALLDLLQHGLALHKVIVLSVNFSLAGLPRGV